MNWAQIDLSGGCVIAHLPFTLHMVGGPGGGGSRGEYQYLVQEADSFDDTYRVHLASEHFPCYERCPSIIYY